MRRRERWKGGGWRDLEPSTLLTTTGPVSSYDLTAVLRNWHRRRSARRLVPRPRRGDESSFARTQYSIFLVTISPGEFIDFPFLVQVPASGEGEGEGETTASSRADTVKKDEEENAG